MTLEITYDDYLAHYGVKGMKWGVRRDVGPDGLVGSGTGDPKTDSSKMSRKTKRQIKNEAKYLNKGHDIEVAKEKAKKRIQRQNVAGAIAGTAVTAAAAYVANDQFQKRFQAVNLPMGAEMKNVHPFDAGQDFDRRLYVTMEERDTQKYRGLLANTYRKNRTHTTVYESTLKATENIKAPSHNQAKKLYKEFSKQNPKHTAGFDYKFFNRNMVEDGFGGPEFMSFLSDKGYNAVLDSNDQFISGYSTRKPLILFNAKSSTSEVGRTVIRKSTSDQLESKQMAAVAAKAVVRENAPTVGLGVAAAGVIGKAKSTRRFEKANKYFVEHPDSKLTYSEVYANVIKEEERQAERTR